MLHLLQVSTKWWKAVVRRVIIGKWKQGRHCTYSPHKTTGNVKEKTEVMKILRTNISKLDV